MYSSLLLAENLHKIFYGDNWTDVCLSETLKGVSYRQAIQQTDASANTIAALVHHLWFWNTIVLQRMQGNNPLIPEQNGMDAGPINNEADWRALIEKLRSSFDALIAATREFPPEKMNMLAKERTTTIGFNILGIIEHAHYHLGQIVLLKNLVQK